MARNMKSHISQNPPVVLDAAYFDRLQGLASAALQRTPDVADRLFEEIERAEVLPSSQVPPNVVNIASTVTYRDDTTSQTKTVVLVMPGEADISQGRVSVLTPVGAALIGLAKGASISWKTLGGETRQLTITEVAPGQ